MNNNLRIVLAIVKDMQAQLGAPYKTREELNRRYRTTLGDISRMTGLNDNTVAKALGELADKGYIQAHVNKYVRWSLTPKCKEYIRRLAKKNYE